MMSLIDFPNVPLAPGVPDIRRSSIGAAAVTGILGAVEGADYFGLLNQFLGDQWSILDKNGNAVLYPDSFIRIEYRGEEKIATHPVEAGSFADYNKVAMPFDIRLRMTCNGQGKMTRDTFLAQMETMRGSLDLYSIVTPDATYANVNLEHYDYRRESRSGVSLLTVDAWFTEIRITATATYTNTNQPSGQDAQSVGPVKSVAPTAAQTASYKSTAVQ